MSYPLLIKVNRGDAVRSRQNGLVVQGALAETPAKMLLQ